MRAISIFLARCLALLVLGATARGDIILSYSVDPWVNPFITDCTISSPGSPTCATGSVGAYSNTITLAPGVPQTAILFPVIFTEPANGAFLVQSGPLLPTVHLSYTNTATGQTGNFSAQLAAEYLTGSVSSIYEQLGPDVFTAPGLALQIDPISTLGPVVAGSAVTYNATGIFQDPLPIPEPSSWTLTVTAAGLCLALHLRMQGRCRSRLEPTFTVSIRPTREKKAQ